MSLIIPYLNKYPQIDQKSFIASNASIIGDVIIDPETSIWFGTIIRGDVANIKIGSRTNIQDSCVIHVTRNGGNVTIGNNVTIGHKAMIHACNISDYSFVGMGAIILDGATMEPYSMLAAGSVLTPNKIIPTGELWSGLPAKFMRKLSEEEMGNIKKSADNYWELAQNYINNR